MASKQPLKVELIERNELRRGLLAAALERIDMRVVTSDADVTLCHFSERPKSGTSSRQPTVFYKHGTGRPAKVMEEGAVWIKPGVQLKSEKQLTVADEVLRSCLLHVTRGTPAPRQLHCSCTICITQNSESAAAEG